MTMAEPAHEVHAFLTTLRTELLEEAASLKTMKRNIKRYRRDRNHRFVSDDADLSDVSLRTMSDTIRHLIRQFEELERPFLVPGEQGIGGQTKRRKRRRNSTASPHYEHSAYASPPGETDLRNRSKHDRDDHEKSGDEDKYWAQRVEYAKYGWRKRLRWLYKKGQAQRLSETLTRVQVRRIAKQMGGFSLLIHEYGSGTVEMNEMVRRIDERMSRFVGVRRVEE